MDFGEFHRVDLPACIAESRGSLVEADAASLAPLAFRLSETGEAFTYRCVPGSDGGTVAVDEGVDDARCIVVIDQASFDGLMLDLESAPGLLYSGRATAERGNLMHFIAWEPALRALWHGIPIFDVHHPPVLADLDGSELDPARSFTLGEIDAQPDMAAHFLRTAGYLHVRGVFDADEVAAMLATTEKLEREADPDDRGSWWATTDDGTSIVCRVLEAAHEPAFAGTASDERLARVVALSDFDLVVNNTLDNESVTVLYKRPGVSEGLADLPWHRDCGMGGHGKICPRIVATICLTTGTAEAGELRVIPGSHRGSFHFIDGTHPDAPTGVPVTTTAGDISIHYSDVAHVSLPPTSAVGPHRISVLVDFGPGDLTRHQGEGRYNDALFDQAEGGRVAHLRDQVTS